MITKETHSNRQEIGIPTDHGMGSSKARRAGKEGPPGIEPGQGDRASP